MAYSIVGSSGPCVVTAGFSGNQFTRIIVHEISGIDSSSPLDQYKLNYQTYPGTSSDAITSGSITTNQDENYIFGVTIGESCGGGILTAGSSYTARVSDTSGSCPLLSEDVIQGSSGTIAATFQTAIGWSNYITGIMAFRAASASSTPSPPTDTIPPVVSLISPSSGVTLSGSSVTLTASASDNIGIA